MNAHRFALAWCAVLILVCVSARQPVGASEPLVTEVRSVGITVSDLDRSIAFYQDVLDFHPVAEFEVAGDDYEQLYGVFGLRQRIERMRLGTETIELMQFLAPAGRPMPVDSRSNDRWFQHVAIIVSDMDRAYAQLRAHRVAHASPGPQRLPDWNPKAGGIRAFYFRDPDGNVLEILQFPPGKGAARWQPLKGRKQGLFLGIDHTAIVVADTDASLRYYRDLLGLTVAGESDNYGPEQERLNNVFGAHLRITALKTGSGPGIELLEYLAPGDGRPMPADTHATDLWHWQVNASAPDLDAALGRLRAEHRTLISPRIVSTAASELGFRQGLLVRDPDGHALLLEQAQ